MEIQIPVMESVPSFHRVMMIARPMAAAPRRLPLIAVFGLFIRWMPYKMAADRPKARIV